MTDDAVIGADDLEAGTHIFVKLRPCTIRKTTRHCPGRECYFEDERQYVEDFSAMLYKEVLLHSGPTEQTRTIPLFKIQYQYQYL